MVLDLRSGPDEVTGVEAKHDTRCSLLHDHRLCALLFRAVWSPSLTASAFRFLAPRSFGLEVKPRLEPSRSVPRSVLARAPPTLL